MSLVEFIEAYLGASTETKAEVERLLATSQSQIVSQEKPVHTDGTKS